MLTATGNINQPYEVLGVVHATIARQAKKTGCGGAGGLPVQEAYEAATQALVDATAASGGDGVIHIGYDYRLASSQVGCGGTSEPLFEVYSWGTAVKLR